MEVLGGSHSYTHHCVNDENTHRDKRWSIEHAVAITASCCLAAWRNQKPHIKLSQPELHTYHLLIGNTDKNHPFPILSRVQPSDSFINGHEIKTASVSTERTSSKIFVKILYDLISENHPWKISTSEDLIKCWSWNWFQHWWAWIHRRTQDCLGITALNICFSRFWWASQLELHCYEGLFSHTMWISLLSKAQGHQACVYLDSKGSNN